MESCSLKAYPDAGGWSIGYGHHGSDVYQGMKISSAQAKMYLKSDVAEAEACVNRNMKGISLSQNEFNACVSMAYNRGCTGFVTSDVWRKIQENKKTEAAQLWLQSGVTAQNSDKVLDSLVSRRAQEAAMFAGGVVKKPTSDSTNAAMLPDDSTKGPTTIIPNGSGSSEWKTLGWLALIGGAIYAGNKWGIPAWKKYS